MTLYPGGTTLPRLRAKVPVSMHRPDEGDGVANRDSFFCVDLDVSEEDPMKRLDAIHLGTTERKVGGDASVLDALLNRGPRRFAPLSRLAARWSMSPRVFALNVSNVRGPAEPLAVIGRPVRAELPGGHALSGSAVGVDPDGRLLVRVSSGSEVPVAAGDVIHLR